MKQASSVERKGLVSPPPLHVVVTQEQPWAAPLGLRLFISYPRIYLCRKIERRAEEERRNYYHHHDSKGLRPWPWMVANSSIWPNTFCPSGAAMGRMGAGQKSLKRQLLRTIWVLVM